MYYMLHILSKRIAFLVCKKTDKIPFEIYVYGFELLVSSIIETGALILIGGLIGKFVETILFIISFSSIRFFSGGYHANSYLKCFVVTMISYILILLMTNILSELSYSIIVLIALMIFVLSLILFIKICPVYSNGKTIFNPTMQKKLSVIALCINIILSVALFSIHQNYMLIIVLLTIFTVDAMIIIEKLKQGVEKNEKNK